MFVAVVRLRYMSDDARKLYPDDAAYRFGA